MTKNFSDGVVIGGNPAHVIGNMQILLKKRLKETEMKPAGMTKEEEARWMWSGWKKHENKDEHT